MVLKLARKKKVCQVTFKQMMILIQQFLPVQFYALVTGNPTPPPTPTRALG